MSASWSVAVYITVAIHVSSGRLIIGGCSEFSLGGGRGGRIRSAVGRWGCCTRNSRGRRGRCGVGSYSIGRVRIDRDRLWLLLLLVPISLPRR